MKTLKLLLVPALGWLSNPLLQTGFAADTEVAAAVTVKIVILDPPEKDFFSKLVDFRGIPIKAHKDVSDEAMQAAYDRLSMLLGNQPQVVSNIAAAGAELHIIGRNQVTTDLPEWRHDKGKPLPEYNGLTRDQRTRGMGGRLTSCGEENLLKLPNDRYAGRDICAHEFSHCIYQYGIQPEVRARIREQYNKSLEKGLWKRAYAATNPNEFFAELTMWYFGTHGDLRMEGTKPGNGPEGLKAYDPEAFALLDDFYSGRIEVTRVEPRPRRTQPQEEEKTPPGARPDSAVVP
jgi:alpha-glucosidase